ncbi:MAG: hypothetical protein M0P99_02720 [Candidatus Cloacimonetes bacterium]|nr:hypothetical protein [Candidatus Cloacimonadota bacterium]
MDKKQSYHINIKNLETKQNENFLLSSDPENPLKVVGVDNLAPKYQVGKMEYGDFTNHSVWAQGSWAEGGGAEFWDPYKDGYNVYPYSKKYFSKSGLRTIDYPGKLVLGANAALIENFPEKEGYIAAITKRNQMLFVAVNLQESCKIYKTTDAGLTWSKIYDSAEQGDYSSSYDLKNFKIITSMAIGYPDATDKNLAERKNPDEGYIIPSNMWDNWWQERRSPWNLGGLYFTVKSDSNLYWSLRIPFTDQLQAECGYAGVLMEEISNRYTATNIVDDYETVFNCTTFIDAVKNGAGVDMEEGTDMGLFFVGQYVDIYDGASKLASKRIEAIAGERLFFTSGGIGADGTPRTLKLATRTKVVVLDKPITELWMGKDFQGNSIGMHPYNFIIKNTTTNEDGFVQVSCGNRGISHQKVIYRTYEKYSSLGQTRRTTGSPYYYTFYVPPIWVPGEEENPGYWIPEERDGYTVDADTRNYIVVKSINGSSMTNFATGDFFEINKVTRIKSFMAETPLIGIYPRKTTTLREREVFFNGSSRVWRLKFPGDLWYNAPELSQWFIHTGEASSYYVNEQQRELVFCSKNTSVIQSYVYEVDDATAGTAASIFDVGEATISTVIKHNESIYVGTSDKGKIYEWNGQTYKVLERLTLDPLTNSHLILASELYQNKILMTDNFNGRVMSYDPEEDVWDDLCSPEYVHERGNLITSFGVIGGTLFFGTNRADNLFWKFDDKNMSDNGFVISSWYDADMPAIDKRGLYIQVLAEQFIRSGAKVRVAVQFDYQDGWYYMSTKRGQLLAKTPNRIHEATYEDIKTTRAIYFFFPYDTPKWKTARYRMEIYGGKYRTKQGRLSFFRPVINNIDIFYILTDPKEYYFTYPIVLENRQQLLDGPGSNEIGRHRDKLDFLLDIWNNDTMVEITHINGEKYTCIPFKPVQMTGGGMSVIYQNIDPSRTDLDKLSFLATMSFKNINKIDNFG